MRKGALRRPTEASPPHLTPPLLTLSTNAAQTAADGSATAGCSTGATEPGFSPAPNRWEIIISPLLRCRDPSITPRYPCVPYLTVTTSPAQPWPLPDHCCEDFMLVRDRYRISRLFSHDISVSGYWQKDRIGRSLVRIIMPSPLIGGGIKQCFVWRLSVTYIEPNSRTERPRKTKIGNWSHGQLVSQFSVTSWLLQFWSLWRADLVNFVICDKVTSSMWRGFPLLVIC